ncbi:hypothetical protein ABH922_003011 [Rhodococcus sp. 27YEA15]|uniref:hypothetical protein n=1 Tax=Rhodococcus sp. 27YEA15 TaxID=3156259 RepID=UPI003C7BBBBA
MTIYFVGRDDRAMLDKLLGEVPSLVEDLAVTVTRQDRIGKGGAKIASGENVQPLPFNVGASDAGDRLRNELAGWARHVCESRGLVYTGSASTAGVALWLRRNLASLAMTEGAEEALPSIEVAMRECRRAMDIPPEDEIAEQDKFDVLERVGRKMLHRAGIVEVCEILGRQYPEYAGLTLNRVDSLRKGGHIAAKWCGVMTKAEVFLLADVLLKHLEVPVRERKSTRSRSGIRTPNAMLVA